MNPTQAPAAAARHAATPFFQDLSGSGRTGRRVSPEPPTARQVEREEHAKTCVFGMGCSPLADRPAPQARPGEDNAGGGRVTAADRLDEIEARIARVSDPSTPSLDRAMGGVRLRVEDVPALVTALRAVLALPSPPCTNPALISRLHVLRAIESALDPS